MKTKPIIDRAEVEQRKRELRREKQSQKQAEPANRSTKEWRLRKRVFITPIEWGIE